MKPRAGPSLPPPTPAPLAAPRHSLGASQSMQKLLPRTVRTACTASAGFWFPSRVCHGGAGETGQPVSREAAPGPHPAPPWLGPPHPPCPWRCGSPAGWRGSGPARSAPTAPAPPLSRPRSAASARPLPLVPLSPRCSWRLVWGKQPVATADSSPSLLPWLLRGAPLCPGQHPAAQLLPGMPFTSSRERTFSLLRRRGEFAF